jgi:soluble lytic murein transglycosylase
MISFVRLSLVSTLVTPALIALSCSHLSLSGDALSSQQESLLLAYQKAKSLETSDRTGSCSLFTRLSKENFPLKELSLIRAYMTCDDKKPLALISQVQIDQEPWLAPLDLKRQMLEAEASQNYSQLSQIYLKAAKRSDRIREKIEFLNQALLAQAKVQNPTPDELARKTDLQERLHKLAPRFLPAPESKDFFAVGNDWIYQRQFAKGRDYLAKVFNSASATNEEQYQARRAFRNSFKTELKRDEHIKQAEKFAKWNEKHSTPNRIHEAYLTWARAVWTLGDAGTAKEILNRAEKALKKHKYQRDEILFVRARMLEEAKDVDGALNLLELAAKESRPGTPTRARVLFQQAWLLRKKGQFPEASLAFAKIKSETQDPFDRNRYSFWLARSLKQAGKFEDAQKELQELIQNDPLGYYGLVAYREISTELPPLSLERKTASEEKRPHSVSSSDHQMIRALIFVDEPEILGRFLDSKTLDLRNQANQELDAWVFYLKAYARAGLYNPLFQQIGGLPTELKAKLLAQNPELLFPRKFLDLIQTSADKFGVRPELMLSIIRQESAFDPHARSNADALGLMQVLPSVAKVHESKTGLEIDHFEDLYKPEMNIPIGASILSDLGKKYRGQFLLTAAAYNASERAIESWIKTRLNEDPLEFIEDIPYEETRGYVKLVLRNFIFYSRLSTPGQKLAFPNWCLEDLQSFKVSTR